MWSDSDWLPCVDWPAEWRRRGQTKKDLHECFSAMGPFDPTIAAKYKHTLAFYGGDPSTAGSTAPSAPSPSATQTKAPEESAPVPKGH